MKKIKKIDLTMLANYIESLYDEAIEEGYSGIELPITFPVISILKDKIENYEKSGLDYRYYIRNEHNYIINETSYGDYILKQYI